MMLVMPSSVGIALILVGLLLLVSRARRGSAWMALRMPATLALAGVGRLYLASTPLVATMLSRSLERLTPYLRAESAPNADAIVVLGGGQSGHLASDGTLHLQGGRGGDRLEQGLRAFKAGKAPLLVLGGGSFGLPNEPMVGDFMRQQAVASGVPPASILVCGEARYTTDEGTAIAELMRPHGVRRILLCTSATHMPRARLVYERLGFEVTGIPCDFDTRGEGERWSPLLLVPRGQALFQTENGIKEWIGFGMTRLSKQP